MAKKLFVSNLDFEINADQLREMFEAHGACSSAVVALDRETKKSKGFAFIEMDKDAEALNAIEALNNKIINGRPMKVVEDRGKSDSRDSSGEQKKYEILPPIQRMQLFKRKKRLDPFSIDPEKTVDYRDTKVLSRYISERGKILSRRLTGLSAYNQRQVSRAIKRAQNLGLIPASPIHC